MIPLSSFLFSLVSYTFLAREAGFLQARALLPARAHEPTLKFLLFFYGTGVDLSMYYSLLATLLSLSTFIRYELINCLWPGRSGESMPTSFKSLFIPSPDYLSLELL